MSNIDILIIPYRDLYFLNKYGPAVRDLQMLELIIASGFFKQVFILNRPVSLYERVLSKRSPARNIQNATVFDSTSFDVLGPLTKRRWTRRCYQSQIEKLLRMYETNDRSLIVLDFTPLAILPIIKRDNIVYWHDMIDNFVKHNRFSNKEKNDVKNKYRHVADNYHFLSAVSSEACKEIVNINHVDHTIVPNGVFVPTPSKRDSSSTTKKPAFDLGFIGFITNKFDVATVRRLAQQYSVVVYGEILDKNIGRMLLDAGINIGGPFSYNQLPELLSTFKVGLLPYLPKLSHDGSPLKLYEYLKHNLPCITTIDYEFSCEYVFNINTSDTPSHVIDKLISTSGNSSISATLPPQVYLKHNLENVLLKVIHELRNKQ